MLSWGGPFPILPKFFWKEYNEETLLSPIDSWGHAVTVERNGWDWQVLENVTVVHDRHGPTMAAIEKLHGTESKTA